MKSIESLLNVFARYGESLSPTGWILLVACISLLAYVGLIVTGKSTPR